MSPYLILAIVWIVIWLILFFLYKGTRKKMIVMSCAVILFSFFNYYSRPGYWHPPTLFSLRVDIEDILFGFAFGGIASVLYPFKSNKRSGPIKAFVRLKNLVVLSPALIVSLGLFLLFNINIMITLPIGLLIGCLVVVIVRPDLAKRLLFSGLCFGFLYLFVLDAWIWIFRNSQEWWNLNIYGGITILNVPLGEVLFGFLFGAFWSVFYEFVFDYKLEK